MKKEEFTTKLRSRIRAPNAGIISEASESFAYYSYERKRLYMKDACVRANVRRLN